MLNTLFEYRHPNPRPNHYKSSSSERKRGGDDSGMVKERRDEDEGSGRSTAGDDIDVGIKEDDSSTLCYYSI